MSPLFGTDGIRGPANHYPITPQLALELGVRIGEFFRPSSGRTRVMVGRDTRLSGPMLEAALTAGLLSSGAEVTSLGVIPTPAVATLTQSLKADAGVVLSASHNPFSDNGLKIFQGNGCKCDDALEQKIEAALAWLAPGASVARPEVSALPHGNGLGRLVPLPEAAALYQESVLASWPKALDLRGVRIVVDAANGAAYQTTPATLRALGAEVTVFNDHPDGVNINQECGSTHPEVIEALVRQTGAHLGISHDGDADRVVCCDELGVALDGDEVLAIIGLDMLRGGRLRNKTLVATVMSNLALDELFLREGGSIRRSAVGDRAVLEEMMAHDLNFGGEQSGHLIFRDYATAGDGLLSALQLLRVMRETGKPLSVLRQVLQKYPQLLVNVQVRERIPFNDIDGVVPAIKAVEDELGAAGRVLLRYSGTEPKARLLLEAKEADALPRLAERILAPLRAAIGI